MNELDVVRVKNTERAEELFHGGEVEIEANWRETIVADADTSTFMGYSDTPCLKFTTIDPDGVSPTTENAIRQRGR